MRKEKKMERIKWRMRPDYEYLGNVTHEVECPVCRYRETYSDYKGVPKSCYICDERREL